MASNHLFFYFGDDEGYFRALQGEFNRHTKIAFDFKRCFETSESAIQSLFTKTYKDKPSVVMLDFSKHSQEYLHLARIIARTPFEHKIMTVGLVDYLSPPEVLIESLSTGVDFTHIKSTETFDVVFDVARLIAPAELPEHGFAIATLKDEWEAGIAAKIGFIDSTSLHIESNFALTKGARVKLKHHWLKNKMIPSEEVFVRETSSKNLFYHYTSNADLDFTFVDQFLPPDGMELEKYKEKMAEREDLIKHSKKQLKKWIDDNISRSHEKIGKMLVIDRAFSFYENQPRSDKHPYVIRCLPYLDDISMELDRLQPQVIAFAMDKPTHPEPKNTQQKLVKLSEVIKVKYKDLNPFIVVFDSPLDSKELQNILGYPNVMGIATELSVELLNKMAEMFEKKRATATAVSAPTDRVFLRKTNINTYCEIMITVKVTKISETDMFFNCTQTLPEGTTLHLTQPVDMYINVQSTKTVTNPPTYHGLIHCLGEAQKKELRRYVNSVFFREHDAALSNDVQAFKSLNDAKLHQKIAEASSKVQAELEKKEQEALKDAATKSDEKVVEKTETDENEEIK